jgi:uncharacterized RDD family membrane protein YckC
LNYAGTKSRIFAKFIDLLIVLFLGLVIRGGGGSVLGFLYSIVADGMPFQKFQGQSIGKRIMGIKILPQGGHHTLLKSSVIRNIPVGLITFLMIIPFWGWILSLVVGIPLGLIEISLIMRADKRQRLGDVMAETVVLKAEKTPENPRHDLAI